MERAGGGGRNSLPPAQAGEISPLTPPYKLEWQHPPTSSYGSTPLQAHVAAPHRKLKCTPPLPLPTYKRARQPPPPLPPPIQAEGTAPARHPPNAPAPPHRCKQTGILPLPLTLPLPPHTGASRQASSPCPYTCPCPHTQVQAGRHPPLAPTPAPAPPHRCKQEVQAGMAAPPYPLPPHPAYHSPPSLGSLPQRARCCCSVASTSSHGSRTRRATGLSSSPTWQAVAGRFEVIRQAGV